MGPKSGNVEKVLVLQYFLKGQGDHEYSKEKFQLSEPWHLGGGRRRVNPPPRRLVWRFWEVWRVWNLVQSIYMPGGQRPRRNVQQSVF